MIDRQIVLALQAAHAVFGVLLFAAFAYQAGTGWRNRRDRLAGEPVDAAAVRRHRKLGPLLALLLPVAYAAGLVTAVLDTGDWLRYPVHLAVGTLLVVAAAASAVSGRRIRARTSPWRTPHAVAGAITLALFVVQALLGAGILF